MTHTYVLIVETDSKFDSLEQAAESAGDLISTAWENVYITAYDTLADATDEESVPFQEKSP